MGMGLSMGIWVGLSCLLLAISTVLGVLRVGRRRRYRRDDRHRPVSGSRGGAALLLRATLSPPVSPCWHHDRRGAGAGSGSCAGRGFSTRAVAEAYQHMESGDATPHHPEDWEP